MPATDVVVHGTNESNDSLACGMLAVELGGKFAVLKSAEGAEITEQNPLGQVPYMKEGDTTLAESAAILRYLGREYAPKKYKTGDEGEEANIDLALDWCTTSLANDYAKIWPHSVGLDSAPSDQTAHNEQTNKNILTFTDKFLQDRMFVGGDTLSIADYKIGVIFYQLSHPVCKEKAGFTPSPRTLQYVRDWLKTLTAESKALLEAMSKLQDLSVTTPEVLKNVATAASTTVSAECASATGGLAKEVEDQNVAIQKRKDETEAAFNQRMLDVEGTSGVTKKKNKERATVYLNAQKAEIEEMEKKVQKEKDARLADNRRQASGWKEDAIKKERQLQAQAIKRVWTQRVARGEERLFTADYKFEDKKEDHFVPKSKKEIATFLSKNPMNTPYDGAFVFLMTLYRLTNVRGGPQRTQTFDMLREVMHVDCLTEKADGTMILRKHTRIGLNSIKAEVVNSFFTGTGPIQGYKVDETKPMSMRLKSNDSGYTHGEKSKFSIAVVTSGSSDPGNITRTFDLECSKCSKEEHEGSLGWKWQVRTFNALGSAVVEEFDPKGASTQEELDRERAYRQLFELPPPAGMALKESEKDYVAPKANRPNFEKVDIYAKKKEKQEEEYERLLSLKDPEEQARIRAEKVAKRTARAQKNTAAAAANGVTGEDSDGGDAE